VRYSKRERLRLRAYTATDEAELFDVFADSYARRYYPEMADRANAGAWIRRTLRSYAEFGFGLWAMELKAEGQFIGDCGLTYQEVEGRRELKIGYHVIERERGKGYATEAARSCLDFEFTRTSCESICSIVRPSNKAYCTVAARIHAARREFTKSGKPRPFYSIRRVAVGKPCERTAEQLRAQGVRLADPRARSRFRQIDSVIHRVTQFLLAAEISLSRLD
jgi:ribosomal-protein-alanine N-acetyltransferase